MNVEKKFDFMEESLYEEKLIINTLLDSKFFTNIIDILDTSAFSKLYLREIAIFIEHYYNKRYRRPTFETILIWLQEKEDEFPKPLYEAIEDFIKNIYLKKKYAIKMMADKQDIQENAQEYFSLQQWKYAVVDAFEMIKTKREDKILDRMYSVETAVAHKNNILDYDDIESRKEDKPRKNIVPLPFPMVNESIGGGLGSSETLALIAPMGAGKSTLAQRTALNNKKNGFNTILFTLELSVEFTRHKIDTILLEKEINDVRNEVGEIDKKLKSDYSGKIFIERLKAKSTINEIRKTIRRINQQGHKVDMIIVDYIDLMGSVDDMYNKKDEWILYGQLTLEMRDLIAHEEEVATFILCQGNTSSLQERIITAQSSGGGAKRLFPADLVCGYARPDELKAKEKANFSIIKNRFGKDSIYFEADTDYTIGKIEITKPWKYFAEEMEDINEDLSDFVKKDFLPNYNKEQSNKINEKIYD